MKNLKYFLNETHEYWKEISDKFPNYNSNSDDTKKATDFILKSMMKKYPEYDWSSIENEIRDSIKAGIS